MYREAQREYTGGLEIEEGSVPITGSRSPWEHVNQWKLKNSRISEEAPLRAQLGSAPLGLFQGRPDQGDPSVDQMEEQVVTKQ